MSVSEDDAATARPDAPHLDAGRALEDAGDLAGAEGAYRRSLAAGEPEAAWFLGVLLTDLERPAEAVPILEHGALEGDDDCLLVLGNALSDLGDVDGALATYERSAARGDVGPACHNTGRLLRKLGRPEEAVEPWRRAFEVGHIDAGLFANLLCDAGRFDEALLVLAVSAEAGNAEAWVDIGAIEQDGGRFEQAEEAFRRGLALGAPDAAVFLANVCKSTGRPAEAKTLLEAAAEGGEASAEMQLANDLAAEDLHDPRVEPLYRRAMEHDEDDHAQTNLGVHLVEVGRLDEGVALLEPTAERGDDLARRALSRIVRIADGAEVGALFDVEAEDPDTAARDLAERYLRRVIARGDEPAVLQLALLLGTAGRRAEARQVLADGARRGVAEAARQLAGDLGDDDPTDPEAERLYRRAIELGEPDAQTNLGLHLLDLGREDEAIALLELAAGRGDTFARRALDGLRHRDHPDG